MTDRHAQAAAALTITDRHADGLARHDLRELRERCRRASDGAFREFNESACITTAKGARRHIANIGRNLAATAWAHGQHADRHGTYAGWLVPVPSEDEIAVCCVGLRMPVGGAARIRQWPWLVVPKHAIARGHQRLQDADWLAVQSELREAAMQAAAVQVLSMALGLKQFAIPGAARARDRRCGRELPARQDLHRAALLAAVGTGVRRLDAVSAAPDARGFACDRGVRARS